MMDSALLSAFLENYGQEWSFFLFLRLLTFFHFLLTETETNSTEVFNLFKTSYHTKSKNNEQSK